MSQRRATAPHAMTADTDATLRHVRELFHNLNNQLGIILANAELLQSRVADPSSRARVTQVVDSTLQAMGTAREIRQLLDPPEVP